MRKISTHPQIRKLHLEYQPFKSVAKLLRFHSDRLYQYLTERDTFPVYVEVNLTNVCNQKCPWCITANVNANEKGAEYIEIKKLLQFLTDFRKLGGKSVVWSGTGEPTCHPGFVQAVKGCAEIGLRQALITNGTFDENIVPLISNHMEIIKISLDTVNYEEYKKQKGTDINIVIDRIIKLVSDRRPRSTPRIGINVNLAEWNISDIGNILQKSEELGVDYVQFRPILGKPYASSDYNEQLNQVFINKTLSKLQSLAQETRLCEVIISMDKFNDLLKPNYGRDYKACRYHRFLCVLNTNGDLSVCMFHLYDKRFVFGNIYHESLETIWKGKQRKKAIKFCEGGELDLASCQVCCKGHEINKFLDYLVSAEGEPFREVVVQVEEVKNCNNPDFL